MTQKRCLNCRFYSSDEKTVNGSPLLKGAYPYAGFCSEDKKRKKDGWSCGKWKKKNVLKDEGKME